MSKRSRLHGIKHYSDTLSDRDVSKIRKLLSHDEDLDVKNKTLMSSVHLEDDDHESHGDWENFIESSKNTELLFNELQSNLAESKVQIDEEMSNFAGSLPDLGGIDSEELPQELRDHIGLLTDVLKNYRSGSLPKTLKVLPHVPGWEYLLELLKPLDWSVHVFPKVVKVFASKGHEPALHFYEQYLLPKVKMDIEENRRLCVHLFEALISSMFRIEEFISGIFLPWIQSEMSKTEGIILSHLIKKATFKSNYAAVALVLLLEEDFSIQRSSVLEAFLTKRYHFPQAALQRVIDYFISFDRNCTIYFTDENRMPLTWFKSLLAFLDFYRDCLNANQKKQLLNLCKRHTHPQITPEIRTLLSLVRSN